MHCLLYPLGVSSIGMSEGVHAPTYDLTLAAARCDGRCESAWCSVTSGVGTDSTERGRTMWARVKGRTENALLALFAIAYMFRPGYIQPIGDVRSKTGWVDAYNILAPLYPVLRPLLRGTTTNFGRALIESPRVAIRSAFSIPPTSTRWRSPAR